MILFPVEPEPIFVELLTSKLSLFDNLLDLLFGEAEEYIFRLEVSVDDSAYPVEEVKTHENLPCNFLDEIEGETLVVIAF
jgi:hypothetical protein